MEVIRTIYKNNKIEYINEKDYWMIKSKKEIKKGDIILVEQCFCENEKESSVKNKMIVKINEELFNELYPRKNKWIEEYKYLDDENLNEMLNEKILKNCFSSKQGIVLGYNISKINHSKNPNAKTFEHTIEIGKEIYTKILNVEAIRDINANEEIYIIYGKGVRFGEEIEIRADEEIKEENKLIEKIIDQYIKKESFKRTILIQLCIIELGLYLLKDEIIITPRFQELYEKIFKEKEIDKEKIINLISYKSIEINKMIENYK
jgi:hypothetical protein